MELNDLIAYTTTSSFDILILDINFNGESSLNYIDEIRPPGKYFKIISLTSLNNEHIKSNALKKGVDMFIGKDSDFTRFKSIIIGVHCSESVEQPNNDSRKQVDYLRLTDRKLEVLQALYKYADKKEIEISTLLNISENSLKSHKRELFEITDTNNTPDLIRFGIKNGLILF